MAAADLPHRRRPSAAAAKVRLLCSFGGKIVPRPQDHQLRYIGGETRLIVIPRSISFSLLHYKLSKLSENPTLETLKIKYQLPHEDLDSLISISCDEDVEIMMEEYDRFSANGDRRFRIFLFQSKLDWLHERWFEDALKCGGAAAEPPRDGGSEPPESPPAASLPAGPVYFVPAQPVGPVSLHASYGMPRPVLMTQTGLVHGVYRGSIGSINPTARINQIYRGSMYGGDRMGKGDPWRGEH